MNLKIVAKKILGRTITSEEGITSELISAREIRLKIEIPPILKEFYTTLGNNPLFTDGFQHFIHLQDIFINDNKLVFLKENQEVIYWAVALDKSDKVYQTVYQDFSKKVEWFEEEFALDKFLEMMLYYQCMTADESYHQKSNSGFRYATFLEYQEYQNNQKAKHFVDNLDQHFENVVHGNGLSMYWKPTTLIMYYLNQENQIGGMITSYTKSELVLNELIEEYGFGEF